MEKDLTLALDAAKSVKARLPLGSTAHQLYGLLIEHGYAEKDFSVVFEYLYPKHNNK
jgi:3-hydroxyisobutyrate dehydrogenase-like beta-hydroxyacid dehydrogenase